MHSAAAAVQEFIAAFNHNYLRIYNVHLEERRAASSAPQRPSSASTTPLRVRLFIFCSNKITPIAWFALSDYLLYYTIIPHYSCNCGACLPVLWCSNEGSYSIINCLPTCLSAWRANRLHSHRRVIINLPKKFVLAVHLLLSLLTNHFSLTFVRRRPSIWTHNYKVSKPNLIVIWQKPFTLYISK